MVWSRHGPRSRRIGRHGHLWWTATRCHGGCSVIARNGHCVRDHDALRRFDSPCEVPSLLWLIVSEAFNPTAVGGGFIGIMLIGVSRGVFSNEAGVGTEVMAHGAAKTNEPIREGMVATLGPIFDTLLVCTCTALVILLAGEWQDPGDLSALR